MTDQFSTDAAFSQAISTRLGLAFLVQEPVATLPAASLLLNQYTLSRRPQQVPVDNL
jgi:hypothetical protein